VVAAALALPPTHASAQERADTSVWAAPRSLAELLSELPGEPISLAEVRAAALELNLDLAAARDRRGLADARLLVERGPFDPSLLLGWGVARSPDDVERSGEYRALLSQTLPWGTRVDAGLTGTRSPTLGGVAYDAGASLAVTQPLLEGLGTADARARSARALREGAAAELVRATERVMADVEIAYWTLAEAEATQAVLTRSVEVAEALLYRNEALARRELIAEVDVLAARSAVALRRAQRIGAERARVDAAERLAYLAWGQQAPERLARRADPPRTSLTAAEPPPPPVSGADADAVAAALGARRDVLAARSVLAAAEALQRSTRMGLLPALDLVGAYGSTAAGSGYRSALDALGDRRSWSIGLSFSQPLFNRGDRGRDAEADLEVSLGRLGLVLAEHAVRLEVSAARRAVTAGRTRRDAAAEASALAEQLLEAERRRLDLGLGDSFRLLQTEEIVTQAELEAVRARYDLARAATRLRLAMGEG
jgi:outer membrane protein TolC